MKMTSTQYRQLGDIQAQIESLESQRDSILNGQGIDEQIVVSPQMPSAPAVSSSSAQPAKRQMSEAGRKKIAAAQRKRWAKVRAAMVKPTA